MEGKSGDAFMYLGELMITVWICCRDEMVRSTDE